jgi:hypothetical protein
LFNYWLYLVVLLLGRAIVMFSGRLPAIFIATSSILLMQNSAAPAETSLPSAVDAFVTASNALAKAATERVDLGRATQRLLVVRAALTAKLLEKPDAKFSLPLQTSAILCDVRTANLEVSARRNFIQAVAARIEEVGKPSKIDNLETAFRSLFAGQSLDIAAGLPTADDLEKNKAAIQSRCERDVANYFSVYYGQEIGAPVAAVPAPNVQPAEAIPAFIAISALIDTISKIITPIVVDGAKLVDEQRRRDAIVAFLGAPGNIRRVEDSGVALSREISAFTFGKRLRLAGSFSESTVVLKNVAIDLTKEQSCKVIAALGTPIKPDKTVHDEFVLCWRAAWAQAEPATAAMLKAAEQYDQLADAGDTDNARKAFEPLAKSLAAISAPGDDGLIKFWNWATRLVAFAQKVESSFSKENQDKISKAIDDLVRQR